MAQDHPTLIKLPTLVEVRKDLAECIVHKTQSSMYGAAATYGEAFGRATIVCAQFGAAYARVKKLVEDNKLLEENALSSVKPIDDRDGVIRRDIDDVSVLAELSGLHSITQTLDYLLKKNFLSSVKRTTVREV